MNAEFNNIPQWMIDSKTDITEQNDEVGLIVAGYIGAFRKRGFTEKQIGSMLSSAFLLPLEEVEKRIDAVLTCGSEDSEDIKNLCVFAVQKGGLFSTDDTDPCEIIEIIKNTYGKTAAFETLLTFPQILLLWKKSEVRDLPENKECKEKAEKILYECASVFPEIK